jgi:cobalt-zinc-cadmium efflux system protein
MHDHHHHHHHAENDPREGNAKRLILAIVANMGLTLVQLIAGLAAGSLALMADALHNFADAGSIILALVAMKISRRPADSARSFGYARAESIAALINYTTVLVLSIGLLVVGVRGLINPQPAVGVVMMAVAGVALAVDLFTAVLTYAAAKSSQNMRAVFAHNLSDALTSVGVIAAGALVMAFGWYRADAVMSMVIATAIIVYTLKAMPAPVHLLMEGAPAHIDRTDVCAALAASEGVDNVHHVHIWQLDEKRIAIEAHVVISDMWQMDRIKKDLKTLLAQKFEIHHATLEMETGHCADH